MDAVVKRFLHLNKLNDEIWQEYKKIVAKDEKSPSEKPKSSKKNFKISPIKKTNKDSRKK